MVTKPYTFLDETPAKANEMNDNFDLLFNVMNKLLSTGIDTVLPLLGGGNLSANRTLSIPKATASQDGYVAKADFAAFVKRHKIGSFTRDLSLSGTQEITGIGFPLKSVIFFATKSGTPVWSYCVAIPSSSRGHFVGWNGLFYEQSFGDIVTLSWVAGVGTYGRILSVNDDGFNIGWYPYGSPTGTATINYLAIG